MILNNYKITYCIKKLFKLVLNVVEEDIICRWTREGYKGQLRYLNAITALNYLYALFNASYCL